MCARTLLFMYMTRVKVFACVMCSRAESEGQVELHTHPHTPPVTSCVLVTILNMDEMAQKGSVTLGQGDRSGQVCVCERTLVCQRFVPGQQVASQRT